MEKQKVFWVVLSVSLFVVVVLVVGVLLLRQKPVVAGPRTTVTPMTDTGTQVYEYQREAPPSPTPGQPGTTGGDQQTMHFYIGEGGTPAQQTPSTTPPAAGTAQPSAPVEAPPPAPAPIKPPSVSSAKPRSAAPAPQTRPLRKAAEYWIQTGSYKSQDKAEELVAQLGGKGLNGRVFSYSAKNETFYRVRVGPYSNKGEADKFLALVKQVQGLEASFISLVPASKSSVN